MQVPQPVQRAGITVRMLKDQLKAIEGKRKVQLYRKQGDTGPGVWQETSSDGSDRIIDSIRLEKPLR